jgi:hypothetical protein
MDYRDTFSNTPGVLFSRGDRCSRAEGHGRMETEGSAAVVGLESQELPEKLQNTRGGMPSDFRGRMVVPTP